MDSFVKVDMVLNFFNRKEILIEKLVSRRVCAGCHRNYNIADINTPDGYIMKPLLPKKTDPLTCDDCGGLLKQRDDDKEEVISERLDLYEKETKPLIDFYRQKSEVIDFEAKKGVDDYPMIKEVLERKL